MCVDVPLQGEHKDTDVVEERNAQVQLEKAKVLSAPPTGGRHQGASLIKRTGHRIPSDRPHRTVESAVNAEEMQSRLFQRWLRRLAETPPPLKGTITERGGRPV